MKAQLMSILGVPVHHLSMESAVNHVMELMDQYAQDHQPKYVATVNVDFINNALAWSAPQIRHPELIDVLRKADLATADGMPIVWLSRLLGYPLPQRVTGADLVFSLCQRCADEGKKVYLFGGGANLAENAGKTLSETYPKLEVAGVASPFIQVEGGSLVDADELDLQLIEDINNAKPDILFIGLGNPKQELWFNRVKGRLKVPVSIGVGGAFGFVVGAVKRAPKWMQDCGAEWLFRLAQEPRRLWKRYVNGAFKFCYMTAPLLLADRLQRRKLVLAHEPSFDMKNSPGAEGQQAFLNIELPAFLSGDTWDTIFTHIEKQGRVSLVLDFSRVARIDVLGASGLLKLWRLAKKQNTEFALTQMPSRMRRLLKAHRLWDILSEHYVPEFTPEKSKEQLKVFSSSLESMRLSLEKKGEVNIIEIDGHLRGSLETSQLKHMLDEVDQKHLIIDLKHCRSMDGAGISILLKFRRRVLVNNHCFLLTGLHNRNSKTLSISKLRSVMDQVSTVQEGIEFVNSGHWITQKSQRV